MGAVAKRKSEPAEPAAESDSPAPPEIQQTGGFKKKTLIYIGLITAAIWAFTIQTGSTVLLIITSVLTALLLAVMTYAFFVLRKQKRMVGLLQGATSSPEARRAALAKLSEGKDAKAPVQLFARAQLLAADDPKAALDLLETMELKSYPGPIQDDVALLQSQLYLSFGKTQQARKLVDTMNLDNPERKKVRSFAATVVAEAWARTGKPKEALALLDTLEPTKDNKEQIALQARIAKVFAKFASNQRNAARTELVGLADENVEYLGRFLAPQFRVHPELQKLARTVAQQHPSARRMIKTQVQKH